MKEISDYGTTEKVHLLCSTLPLTFKKYTELIGTNSRKITWLLQAKIAPWSFSTFQIQEPVKIPWGLSVLFGRRSSQYAVSYDSSWFNSVIANRNLWTLAIWPRACHDATTSRWKQRFTLELGRFIQPCTLFCWTTRCDFGSWVEKEPHKYDPF